MINFFLREQNYCFKPKAYSLEYCCAADSKPEGLRFFCIQLLLDLNSFAIFDKHQIPENKMTDKINYFQKIGEQNLRKLVHDFYDHIASDPILRPMYPMNLAPAEERLFLFLQQFLGGPETYNEMRGLPRLRQRHFPFPVDQKARTHWMTCMMHALKKNSMDDDSKAFLSTYFDDTATFLINRPA